ncbi:MAG: peptide chain release factor N(5)-glutamine methyltransferase [Planctomycetaceae bacterium]|nr:peptide chain release factor N(5)-glutamine methyltransferase [Planctomycetales bacterium]MCB9924100.1 peptide chain release factor N(5)-glutamine methyltransferase [Planctomycetaceae bacterium]
MPDTEAWTVGRLLKWTTDFLKQKESTSPRLDAEVLLATARGCERIELYTAFDEVPSDAVRDKFREMVKRRAAGEPVAYLVGRREFYSLPFKVTRDVLIPRPETELLVVALLDAAKELGVRKPELSIADVGTGSGIVAVCAAKNLPTAKITAIDVSSTALEVARENIISHEVSSRIELIQSDLFSQIDDRLFDVIASNPPYVSESEMKELRGEVAEYEPHLALYGGPTGSELIQRLVPAAAEHLLPGGCMLLEVSPMIEQQTHKIIRDHGGFDTPRTLKDMAGLARVVVAKRAVE